MPCGRSPLSPRCWPAYAALWAANRRQIRETLEKPRSRAQLFKRFCAKGNTCALRLISPFFSLLAGLTALWAANRRLIRETPEKPRSRAQLFGRFCAWGTRRDLRPAGFLSARGNRSSAWACTQKEPRACAAQMQTQTRYASCPPQERVRARHGEERDTVRDLLGAAALEKPRSKAQLFGRFCALGMRRDLRPAGFLSARGNRSSAWAHTRNQPRACETGQRNKHGARLARRRRGWQGKRPKSQRSRAQLFGRFCALGNVWPHILRIHGSLARAFVRQISFWPQGTGVRLFPRPGKQEPGAGHTPGINRVRARLGAYTNPVRDLLTAGARGRSRQGEPLCRQPTHYRQQRG